MPATSEDRVVRVHRSYDDPRVIVRTLPTAWRNGGDVYEVEELRLAINEAWHDTANPEDGPIDMLDRIDFRMKGVRVRRDGRRISAVRYPEHIDGPIEVVQVLPGKTISQQLTSTVAAIQATVTIEGSK